MTKIAAVLALLVSLNFGGVSRADEIERGNVVNVETRGVVDLIAAWIKSPAN